MFVASKSVCMGARSVSGHSELSRFVWVCTVYRGWCLEWSVRGAESTVHTSISCYVTHKGNGVTRLQTGPGEPGRAEACSTLRWTAEPNWRTTQRTSSGWGNALWETPIVKTSAQPKPPARQHRQQPRLDDCAAQTGKRNLLGWHQQNGGGGQAGRSGCVRQTRQG